MVVQSKALSMIEPRTILVAGDLILDQYIVGQSRRISPEAPVPVVLVEREESRAGGAGNVALNLISMGMHPRLLSRVGNDIRGKQLISLLSKEGVDTAGIVEEDQFLTPTKTRVISSSQQLVRIDREASKPISHEYEQKLLEQIPHLFEGVDLVAISDYAKGTLSPSILRAVISYARNQKIPCITDPKGVDFRKYAGSTILKPNALETLRAAPASAGGSVEEAAAALVRSISIDVLMVTRSEEGISLFYPDGRHERFPVQPKEVRDVTGAGDTVLAMLSAAYANEVALEEAVVLCNVAASCAVERLGCARVTIQDVAASLIEQNPAGKICSVDVFHNLKRAFGSDRLLMIRIPPCCVLSSDQLMRLSETISRYPDRHAIACFEGDRPDPRLLELVASLEPMHLVVHGLNAKEIEKSRHENLLFVDL